MIFGRPSSGFHQRRPSLTTACPPIALVSPNDKKQATKQTWYATWPILRLVGYLYVLLSVCIATLHLVLSCQRNYLNQTTGFLQPAANATLDDIPHTLWISKIFSKSGMKFDHVRPHWFTATDASHSHTVTLATVLTPEDWPHLVRLASLWQGPISAALQIPSIGVGSTVKELEYLRQEYDSREDLKKYVDVHLVIRPHAVSSSSLGGRQEARNLARLFSRTEFVAHLPVRTRHLTNLTRAVDQYQDLLRHGDGLVIPSFVDRRNAVYNSEAPAPEGKDALIRWVDERRMGLQDHHWRLNEGPTSYAEWRIATEPYLVTNYDYHYGPAYIATRDHHPWCEERFEDQLPACVYAMFLAGSELWVLPEDYSIREIEPEYALTLEERAMQDQAYKNYRVEQCVFYARKFDLNQILDQDQASHIRQECAKVLGSLRKANMIS
ncbi:hypothetical protein DFQ28_001569 [Apophysomyces sp. BC1034]|nr:hypothetical protein DFQ30_001486 [Apophysomyces sp. BC1015]KAG0182518.1 hypothetical protein DFQ29_003744 [Apophysomyces sp. BC1021]KAG0194077.1 hypothetical protein DFQ28_001569 [Apophysomyces sp. BC1034]